ncbi:SRPBCC family protein [Yinghuangia sp. YIM S09857]|uniref:SRPBCC family protein n=1 Tax=Yinghuangia sp. YIM S09857 TaxID=3436929 RepID=UPI003F53069F
MARRQQLIHASPNQVWAVLADPQRYAEWVVGTQRIERADDTWPQVGAGLAYCVGIGPITFRDECVVRLCDPGKRLELEALAPPLGSARISIELLPWDGETVALVDEHPLRGPAARLHGPPGEALLHLRNRKMLRNLARVAVEPPTTAHNGSAPVPDAPAKGSRDGRS